MSPRLTHDAEASAGRSAIVPNRFPNAFPGSASATFYAILADSENMKLEETEHQVIRERDANGIISLLLHQVTQHSNVWMLHFQREVSIFRFGASQQKGCVSLLREVRRREDCTRAEASCVRLPFVAQKSPMAIRVQDVLRSDLHGI